MEREFLLAKTNPREEPFRKSLILAHKAQCSNAAAIQKAEISHIALYLTAADSLKNTIKEICHRTLKNSLITSICALHAYIVITSAPPRNHLGDTLWRMLEVCIHEDDSISLGSIKTGQHC